MYVYTLYINLDPWFWAPWRSRMQFLASLSCSWGYHCILFQVLNTLHHFLSSIATVPSHSPPSSIASFPWVTGEVIFFRSRKSSGWWFQPLWKIWESSPNRAENKKHLKPQPSPGSFTNAFQSFRGPSNTSSTHPMKRVSMLSVKETATK